jgi:hypothetical protein
MPRQDLIVFARLAYRVASWQLPPYASKFSPKKFSQPSLLACLLVKEYLRLDYRGLEALLVSAAELRAALGLTAVPDHSMAHWFMRHKVTPTLLKRVRTTTLRLFTRRYRRGRRIVTVDATGYSIRPTSRYYIQRWGCWSPRYRLASTVVWTTPQVICAQVDRVGPGSQCRQLRPLVAEAQRVLPIARLLADADYDAEAHHQWLRGELGIESIIPATRSRPSKRLTRQPYRYRMQRWFPRRKYGQRWIAETVHSVIKRKFGEALTLRRPWQQVKQSLLRGLTYNLYRAVQLGLVLCRLMLHRVMRASLALVT